ncbi:MAG: Holliday junction branch migration protein RuvA [Holosporaceae bacterium]|jgi:Holliday junction DNA helicase RuvA|nr:Holliday junction branch migration protein RuvA [Holosporaceae bacterium]
MIAYLKGIVEKISDNSIVVDVNGVGYTVICSARTVAEAKKEKPIHIFTILNVREDAWTLFGFISEKERLWFNMLTSVQGVGGKVAIALLSALGDDDLYNAFLSQDKNMLTRADGIGPKLATRIISELKDKVVGKIEIGTPSSQILPETGVLNDVISALVNLGYQKSDIFRVVSAMPVELNAKFDVLLKTVLAKLSSGVYHE